MSTGTVVALPQNPPQQVAAAGKLSRSIHQLRTLASRNRWSNLNTAICLAREFYPQRLRKNGEPYLTHPVAVTRILLRDGIYEDRVLAASMLHDLLEDGSGQLTARDLVVSHGLDTATVNLIVLLTRQTTETYGEYCARVSEKPASIGIKVADRCHNLATMEGAFTREKMAEYVQETEEHIVPLLTRIPIHSQFSSTIQWLGWRLHCRLLSAKRNIAGIT